MFLTGQIAAKPSGINASNQGDMLRQAYANRGPSQPNNFAFQQPQQMPAAQMQAAQQQMQAAMAQRGPVSTMAQQAPAQGVRSPIGLQQAFNQFQSGTYQPRPNNFAFQQQPQMPAGSGQQMQAAQMQMEAARRQQAPTTFGGIGAAIGDLQSMFGGMGSNIGTAIAGLYGARPTQQRTGLRGAFSNFRAGTYQPQPSNFTFRQQPAAPAGAFNPMQAAMRQMEQARQSPRPSSLF
jgi:hypothetical protein